MTDIQVVTSTVCPTGYTDMYAQTYYGLSFGCDCTNICCGDMNGCNKFHSDTSCDYNQTQCGCQDFHAMQAIKMN